MASLLKTRAFNMKEKMFSLKDKIKVFDKEGNELGYFQGKLIKIGNTFRLRDNDENLILTVKEKAISMRSTYSFYWGEKEDENLIGKLKQKLVSIRPKYWFEDPEGEKLFEMKGKIFRMKYQINLKGKTVAEIKKKLFKIKDSYGVQMSDDLSDKDAMLVLGIVVMLHHEMEEAKE